MMGITVLCLVDWNAVDGTVSDIIENLHKLARNKFALLARLFLKIILAYKNRYFSFIDHSVD